MQFISWPDHTSKETAVNPIEYYGETTFENFVARLFILRPEWAPKITERLRNNINKDGNFFQYTGDVKEIVYFAMSDGQARDEHTNICIGKAFPESDRVYYLLDKLPENLGFVKQNGWEKEIIVQKEDIKKVMKFLYPAGINWDYQKSVDRCFEDEIRIVGFGD